MSAITEAQGINNGREWVYRVRTGDGVWYGISELEYLAIAGAGGGCISVQIHPGQRNLADNAFNIEVYKKETPEALADRIHAARAELAALTERVGLLQKMLTEAM